MPLNEDDMAYIFEDVHRGRSVVPPTFSTSSHPCILRWTPDAPLSWENAVVMTQDEAKRHEEGCLVEGKEGREVWGEETEEIVRERREEERAMRMWK